MNMKIKKSLSVLFVATMGVTLGGTGTVYADTDSGNSDASVVILEDSTPPAGSIKFRDITTNARIIFADTTLTGAEQTVSEKAETSAKIILDDTRKKPDAGKTGAYDVSVKDVTEATEPKPFLANNLVLSLNIDSSSVTISDIDRLVFSGQYEDGVNEKEVVLNPTLKIPMGLDVAGDYRATLQWTLTPEV